VDRGQNGRLGWRVLGGRQPRLPEHRRNLLRAIRLDANTYTHADGNSNSNSNSNGYSDGYFYAHAYTYCYAHRYCHTYAYFDAQADTDAQD